MISPIRDDSADNLGHRQKRTTDATVSFTDDTFSTSLSETFSLARCCSFFCLVEEQRLTRISFVMEATELRSLSNLSRLNCSNSWTLLSLRTLLCLIEHTLCNSESNCEIKIHAEFRLFSAIYFTTSANSSLTTFSLAPDGHLMLT